MPEDQVPLDYLCPVCGEKAVAGSHFCRRSVPTSTARFKPPRRPRNLEGLVRFAGVAAAVIALWSWVGPWSLLGVGATLGLFLLLKNRRR